jgi:FkbM family methyltransferase
MGKLRWNGWWRSASKSTPASEPGPRGSGDHATKEKLAEKQLPDDPQTLEVILGLETRLELMDIGGACINEVPVYRKLIEQGIAHLHVFEGDQRQIDAISSSYGDRATVYPLFLFDGSQQTAYLASEASGMTSLLKPRKQALQFFNGFEQFGRVLSTTNLNTQRLDDIPGVPPIDFLKMDIQGAELTVLKNGLTALKDCMAIQLEVSFITIYEDQPTFGEVDTWMRTQGFVPHCFLDVKRWSISPTIRNNNFREPFNQLLEADIIYIRDPLLAASWSDEQLRKLALIAHDCLSSSDLANYMLLELDRRHPSALGDSNLSDRYLTLLNSPLQGLS